MFKNRREAGYALSKELQKRDIEFDIVLGIPRGGVITAGAIAEVYSCPLDIIMAKKVGSPNLPEYAVGAVAPDGEVLIHERIKDYLQIDKADIKELAERVKNYINNQLDELRNSKKPANLEGKKVLLVDDGIATGFTIKAAVNYLKRQNIKNIIIAVPVAAKEAYLHLQESANEVVVLNVPERFYAVGQFYEDFTPVEDQTVINELYKANY
ncbi:hypothetical protein SYNTR_2032 [Candidatus Syntrophocurvum alkaliphilum]|uniref:Phosphoribosyltransferase domain-containing protein n=1 Tax=Candidatus Syntrophocurvum alkaliphilum TaxID=2293317 RepID=A0A6I6DEX6_9FIRM|nr:phosphoribosyltransferase family protein [Candidatus Syntrophocurvum alkaliphilum]QGU00626.1 hypothetical protein SYNTR_2032 [Candidatus Syntrophocurvum alkaliphilum]